MYIIDKNPTHTEKEKEKENCRVWPNYLTINADACFKDLDNVPYKYPNWPVPTKTFRTPQPYVKATTK